MSDKVQLIKDEIERLKHTDIAYDRSRFMLLLEIEDFIDTLPEEPKCIYNRTLEERKKFCKYCSAACDVRIEEEPANEDLEEAAEVFYDNCNIAKSSWWDEGILHKMSESKETFIAGAEWQKHQMAKDAVETTIVNDWQYGKDPDHAVIPAIHQRIEGFSVDDKVKIIIVEG